MRAARVRITGALHDRETPFIENRLQARETRVKAERLSRTVAADLQDLPCGNRNRRTAAEIEGIRVRDEGAERIVAAGEIDDHQVPRNRALRTRDINQKRGRREADGERCDAAANELTPRDFGRHVCPSDEL